MSTTTTFAYGSNNELVSVSESIGGTDVSGTTFTYDAWGRTNVEAKPSGTEWTYSWTSANMLAGVDSDDPNDTDVHYSYRGDLKRANRHEDAGTEKAFL